MPIDPFFGFYAANAGPVQRPPISTTSTPITTGSAVNTATTNQQQATASGKSTAGGYSLLAGNPLALPSQNQNPIITQAQNLKANASYVPVTSATENKPTSKTPVASVAPNPNPTPTALNQTAYYTQRQEVLTKETSTPLGINLGQFVPSRSDAATFGPIAQLGVGYARGVAGAVDIITEAPVNPSRAVDVAVSSFNPITLGQSASSDPLAFIGETAGTSRVFGGFLPKSRILESQPGQARIVENVEVNILRYPKEENIATVKYTTADIFEIPEKSPSEVVPITYTRSSFGFTETGKGSISTVAQPRIKLGEGVADIQPKSNVIEVANPFKQTQEVSSVDRFLNTFRVSNKAIETQAPALKLTLTPSETILGTEGVQDIVNAQIPQPKELFVRQQQTPAAQAPADITKTPFQVSLQQIKTIQETPRTLNPSLGEEVVKAPRGPLEITTPIIKPQTYLPRQSVARTSTGDETIIAYPRGTPSQITSYPSFITPKIDVGTIGKKYQSDITPSIVLPKVGQGFTPNYTTTLEPQTTQINKPSDFQPSIPRIDITPQTASRSLDIVVPKPFTPSIQFPQEIIKQPTKNNPLDLPRLYNEDNKRRGPNFGLTNSVVGYRAYYKRFGKFKPINYNPVSKSKALSLGIQKTESTLGRTFKIKPAGFVQTLGNQGFSNLDRLAGYRVKAPNVYVQKNALRNISERREIQGFRRLKMKTKGWFRL